jgi:hypothetical protein
MFCWLLTQEHTEEITLVREQKRKHWGIFTCEEHAVVSDHSVEVGGECSVPIGHTDCRKGGWGSWINSWTFVKAWEAIAADGRYRRHDWVVKVDPDTVFFPERMKAYNHMHGWSADDLWWLKNVPFEYPTIGAIEAFSRAAMDAYADRGRKECDYWAVNSAEDEWICKCMTRLGAHSISDLNALQHMKGDQCWNDNIVAFHPHKTTWSYERCVAEATRDVRG